LLDVEGKGEVREKHRILFSFRLHLIFYIPLTIIQTKNKVQEKIIKKERKNSTKKR